ncbi:hypothetical protein BD289DRAFT_195838 [Coniella lustricola]|uniref:Secreted protein n=1 Tax=Coniella lustricola TaxID=2025994 RepID=A0A2T3AMF8_9PEZI|nr:hypothetical protein BD289DRAFT_195838 [Coniella lustricola]
MQGVRWSFCLLVWTDIPNLFLLSMQFSTGGKEGNSSFCAWKNTMAQSDTSPKSSAIVHVLPLNVYFEIRLIDYSKQKTTDLESP